MKPRPYQVTVIFQVVYTFLLLRLNKDKCEVDRPSSALSPYKLRSSSLRPASTGYIPHARTLKSIKRGRSALKKSEAGQVVI